MPDNPNQRMPWLPFGHWETHPNYPIERGVRDPWAQVQPRRPMGFGVNEEMDEHEMTPEDIARERQQPRSGQYRDGGTPYRQMRPLRRPPIHEDGIGDMLTGDKGRPSPWRDLEQFSPRGPEHDLTNRTPRHWKSKPWNFYSGAKNGGMIESQALTRNYQEGGQVAQAGPLLRYGVKYGVLPLLGAAGGYGAAKLKQFYNQHHQPEWYNPKPSGAPISDVWGPDIIQPSRSPSNIPLGEDRDNRRPTMPAIEEMRRNIDEPHGASGGRINYEPFWEGGMAASEGPLTGQLGSSRDPSPAVSQRPTPPPTAGEVFNKWRNTFGDIHSSLGKYGIDPAIQGFKKDMKGMLGYAMGGQLPYTGDPVEQAAYLPPSWFTRALRFKQLYGDKILPGPSSNSEFHSTNQNSMQNLMQLKNKPPAQVLQPLPGIWPQNMVKRNLLPGREPFLSPEQLKLPPPNSFDPFTNPSSEENILRPPYRTPADKWFSLRDHVNRSLGRKPEGPSGEVIPIDPDMGPPAKQYGGGVSPFRGYAEGGMPMMGEVGDVQDPSVGVPNIDLVARNREEAARAAMEDARLQRELENLNRPAPPTPFSNPLNGVKNFISNIPRPPIPRETPPSALQSGKIGDEPRSSLVDPNEAWDPSYSGLASRDIREQPNYRTQPHEIPPQGAYQKLFVPWENPEIGRPERTEVPANDPMSGTPRSLFGERLGFDTQTDPGPNQFGKGTGKHPNAEAIDTSLWHTGAIRNKRLWYDQAVDRLADMLMNGKEVSGDNARTPNELQYGPTSSSGHPVGRPNPLRIDPYQARQTAQGLVGAIMENPAPIMNMAGVLPLADRAANAVLNDRWGEVAETIAGMGALGYARLMLPIRNMPNVRSPTGFGWRKPIGDIKLSGERQGGEPGLTRNWEPGREVLPNPPTPGMHVRAINEQSIAQRPNMPLQFEVFTGPGTASQMAPRVRINTELVGGLGGSQNRIHVTGIESLGGKSLTDAELKGAMDQVLNYYPSSLGVRAGNVSVTPKGGKADGPKYKVGERLPVPSPVVDIPEITREFPIPNTVFPPKPQGYGPEIPAWRRVGRSISGMLPKSNAPTVAPNQVREQGALSKLYSDIVHDPGLLKPKTPFSQPSAPGPPLPDEALMARIAAIAEQTGTDAKVLYNLYSRGVKFPHANGGRTYQRGGTVESNALTRDHGRYVPFWD